MIQVGWNVSESNGFVTLRVRIERIENEKKGENVVIFNGTTEETKRDA